MGEIYFYIYFTFSVYIKYIFSEIYLIQMLDVSLRIYILQWGRKICRMCKEENFQKKKRKENTNGETRQIVQKIISGQSVCLIH